MRSRWKALALTAALSAALLAPEATMSTAAASDNGLATKPLMGWSGWGFLQRDPTAAKFKAQVDALASSGLKDLGYTYANMDDFWYKCPGSQGPDVDSNGRWVTDESLFPGSGSRDGMQVLADYVHGKGMKFGLYVTPGISAQAVAAKSRIKGTSYTADQIATTSSASNFNCKGMRAIDFGKPGAQEFIDSWAQQFADWGVDYLKLDGVGPSKTADVTAWSKALDKTGRPIALNLSASLSASSTWSPLANSWRIDGDIGASPRGYSFPLTSWANVSKRFDDAAKYQPYAGKGGWNDLDSFGVGNGENDGLTPPQRQTNMALWALASSQYMLGADLTNLDPGDKELLASKRLIAIDQDGIPASRVIKNGDEQVFAKREANGTWYIGVFNTDTTSSHTFSLPLAQLGLSGSAKITDMINNDKPLGTVSTYTTSVAAGGVALISAVPTSGTGGTGALVSADSGKCVDTDGGNSYLPGTKEQIWDCNGGFNQMITPTSTGELRTMGATECLDVYENGTTPGTKVSQWNCHGGSSQKWTVKSDGTIVAQHSGLCLDVVGARTGNGTGLQLWTCNGGANQKWSWDH
ncbi:ricin-type beta-trefoil lectin domain protein [Streptomyces sp. SID11385]|uniref:glycoside hydrolase family 27 protein n=1 Tax=Streptomyces sp. SID11385 TaxID=2706031 RepID=UPI0013C54A72|nr:ricin-type beta-trefoil lectin domain protein [Streptomyces sp. SID11385]NEA44042.1 glycoside hydrolase family 27 protein [Streptomyces sp. SID11385]